MSFLDRIRRDRALKSFEREQERKNPDLYLKRVKAERRNLEKYDEIQREKSKIKALKSRQDKSPARKAFEAYLSKVKAKKAKIGVAKRSDAPIGMWAREQEGSEERRSIFEPSGRTPWEQYKK